MTKRQNFPLSVRRAALERAAGFCESRSSELCTGKLISGQYRFDHTLPDGLGGQPTLDNVTVQCVHCDAPKTSGDIKSIARARRLHKKHFDPKPKKPWGGKLRRTMAGKVVLRNERSEQ